MEYLIGLDLGTKSCKAIAINYDGTILASTSRKYGLMFRDHKIVEQDPEDWWKACILCLRDIVEAIGSQVKAIGISSQANTLILLNGEEKVLANAISWLDGRSLEEVRELTNIYGLNNIHQITGLIPNAGFTAPKLLWMKKYRKELLEYTKHIMFSPQSYIIHKLTGEIVVDKSLASFSMLYNIRKERWFGELFETIGISMDLMPNILYSHEVVGELKREISLKLGLDRNVRVVVGGHDQCCAALGAGLIKSNFLVDSTGTASAIIGMLDKIPNTIPEGIMCYHYVIPNKWTILGTLSTSGALLDFYLKMINREMGYEKFEEMARKISVGSDGLIVLPYLSGSFRPGISPNVKGAILGITLSHSIYHIYRAIMEAIGFETKYFLDIIEELGYTIEKVINVGGGSKSMLWREIKANIFGKRVLKPYISDTAPLGASILAGIGTSIYNSFEEAVKKTIRIEGETNPTEEKYYRYQSLYKKYLKCISILSQISC